MRQTVIKTGGISLQCVQNDSGGLTISCGSGNGAAIRIPEYAVLDGKQFPVNCIGKKAFLGMGIREAVLPHTVSHIEAFAFAQCTKLHTFIIEKKDGMNAPFFEKGVFDDCGSLRRICIGTRPDSAASALMGAVPCTLKAPYLLGDMEPGSMHWFEKWDNALVSFIDEDDAEGYTNVVLCGEEGIQRSLPDYIADKRKTKAALCMLRLLNPDYMKVKFHDRYTGYLMSHCKGSESEEAWEIILSDYGDNMEYYRLFAEVGCLRDDNIDDMLLDMDERHTEAKAYLIKYKRSHFSKEDAFAEFEL